MTQWLSTAGRRVKSSQPPKPPPDPRAQARAALEAFWGRSTGGNGAYAVLETALRELRIGRPLLQKLKRNLPAGAGEGTTGRRIRTAAALLEDLAEES